MARKTRHIVACIAWPIASFVAWSIVCNVLTLTYVYLVNHRWWKPPAHSDVVFNWTCFAGFVFIPALVALLAMRAYLPGTGTRPSKQRGFPIDVPPPAGPT